ncbi:MAG: hypothetical protein RBT76_15725 [candidate division Zixibacteria bacterium]|nr:hypothetical protein [candidate division Zixibacteria bacterium]
MKRLLAFAFVALIISGAWYSFLQIVNDPPIDTTPALIMVWVSAIMLLLALFPGVLDRIKKVKIKDFELELQDSVEKAASQGGLTVPDIDEHIFSQKGDFRELANILSMAFRFPHKPILLVANLRDDNYVTIPMLTVYLTYLEWIGSSLTVLFVTSRDPVRNLGDITKEMILGAIGGKKVLREFIRRFPRLTRFHGFPPFMEFEPLEEALRTGSFRAADFERYFRHINGEWLESNEGRSNYLTKRDVRNWFVGELSSDTIELSISAADVRTIRKAIANESEFVLILKDERLNSVVSLCFLTKDVSEKLLRQFPTK